MKKPPLWTIYEGLDVARELEKAVAPAGFHVAIGGGVMLRSASDKDLDLMFYRHRSGKGLEKILLAALHTAGVINVERQKFYKDHKTVYKGFFNGKRIDMFFFLI